MILRSTLVAAAAAAALCAAAPAGAQQTPAPAATPAAAAPKAPQIVLHRAVSVPASYNSNAWWLESDTGLVLIDALMLKSEARQLVAAMKQTGKPLAGIILTHPHLDHVGGVNTVLAGFGKVPVFATRGTAEAVRKVYDLSVEQGGVQGFGADFDHDLARPDRIVATGDTLDLAGMHFVIRDLGPGEADNNTVIFNPELDALFTGDVTVRGAAIYIGEGRPERMAAELKALAEAYPKVATIYSGHYDPAPLASIVSEDEEQVAFLLALGREYVAKGELGADGHFKQAIRKEMVDRIVARYPGHNSYGLPPRMLPLLNVIGLETALGPQPPAK